MKIKQMLRAIYSTKAIYELRKTSIFVTILVAIFLGILQMTPFTILFFGTQPYRQDIQTWALDDDEQRQFIASFPEACQITNAALVCNEAENFVIGEHVYVYFNEPAGEVANGLIFMEAYFTFNAYPQAYTVSYLGLEGLDFGYLQTLDHGYDILFDRIASELRGILVVPFVFRIYQTGIMTYFIYILSVAALAMLLKFGQPKFIKFKEMLNVMVFASMLPVVFVIIIGFMTPAFSTIIFNMGTPLWAYVVYKKHILPGLQESSNEEIEKKECD